MREQLEEIAEQIANDSDGCFNINYSEEYEALNTADRATVSSLIFEFIDNCGICGWYFSTDSLDRHDDCDEPVCWRCYDDLDEEME